jgi:nitrogen-specific signal transduction histidine kinase
MAANLRLRLVGEDAELDKVQSALNQLGITCARSNDLDEACDRHETDPAEVFLLGTSNFYQSSLNQIQKLASHPEVLLVAGEKMPNLAKILMPKVVYISWQPEEIAWVLGRAAELHRRRKRLEALRDHHRRSRAPESNPAIHLVTSIMRKCTIAEDFPDLLQVMHSLRSVIDFHDCSLVLMDAKGNSLMGWHLSREDGERDRVLPLEGIPPDCLGSALDFGEVHVFSSARAGVVPWDSFTFHPWSFGMAMSFAVDHPPRRAGDVRSAAVILYRRELVPFLERDHWLLEVTYGPLALALEKVMMLKAIGQASKEWRSTFDGISEPLTVISSNYEIVKANKAFARAVDQDIKKLKGKRCYTLLAGRRTPCVGCPVGTEHQPQGGTRIQTYGKTKKDLLVWSYGIRTGMESYHFQFYRNVSTETALASTLIQSEKMAALGRLVGAVAHEINNPLAGILATSQILMAESGASDLDPSVREDLEEIRSAAWRSKKIIEDLLGFTGDEEKRGAEANILEAVKSALTFSKSALREVEVRIDCEEETPSAFVPIGALQQVLFNLFTNAAQAMNQKGKLQVRIGREGEQYRVVVSDSGPGIPADRLKNIFDPFFTSKQEGMGTGLGLSIVRNLTQRMHGKIEVQSVVGQGTEFHLYLPRKQAGATA